MHTLDRLIVDSYRVLFYFFFFNDTATTEIYTLSLHDALPIWPGEREGVCAADDEGLIVGGAGILEWIRDGARTAGGDRKSTRLNSSHSQISYAVFCLKKKKRKNDARLSIDLSIITRLPSDADL